MKKRSLIPASLTALFAVIFIMTGCTDVEFDHVLDPQTENYLGNDPEFNNWLTTHRPDADLSLISRQDAMELQDLYNNHIETIGDTIPPKITLYFEDHTGQRVPGGEQVTIYQNDVTMLNKLENTLFTANSGQGIDITGRVVVDATNVNILQPGTYTIIYTVETGPTLADTVTRTVTVIERTTIQEPILQLTDGNTYYFRQGNYSDPGVIAYDPNTDTDISDRVTFSDSPEPINNQTSPGTYTRTYRVTNDAGLTTTRERSFFVQEPEQSGDDVPPVITLHGNDTLRIPQGQEYTEPGYEALDNVDGNITARVQVIDSVDINIPGTYTVEYNVSDMAGNPAEAKYRVVIVEEATGPLPENFIILNGDEEVTWPLGHPYVEIDPPWTLSPPYVDASQEPQSPHRVRVSRSGDVLTDSPDSYTIRYTAVHVNSRVTEVVRRTVIVQVQ